MSAGRMLGEDDPRSRFWRKLRAELEHQEMGLEELSVKTAIPLERLQSFDDGLTGAAVLSDIVAIAAALELPVDSFFS